MLTKRTSLLLAIPVGLILVAYVLYPALETFRLGLSAEGLRAFFSGGNTTGLRALWNSVLISLATVAGSAILGTLLAWILWRYAWPFRAALEALAALPLALPPLVGVLAFLLLYGEIGVFPRLLQEMLALDSVPFRLTGRGGVLFVHVYSFYVYVYLFAFASLRRLDPGLLDASADLGANGLQAFRDVVLPAIRPAVVGASMLVFMLSMASFTAPLLFAGTEPFLTTLIYEAKLNDELALAATSATVLTLICLLFLTTFDKQSGYGVTSSKGVGRVANPISRGITRFGWGIFLTLILIAVSLPVLCVILMSFADTTGWTTQLLPERFTIGHYLRLFTESRFAAPLVNSLWMAALATVANVIFGIAAGMVIARGSIRGKRILALLSALPFAIPGTVIALNLIVVFIEPSPLVAGRVLVGSLWILPLAYFIRNIPLIVQAATSALRGFDNRLAEASADMGAPGHVTLRRVILPAIWPTIMAGTLLAWVAALGEFVASIMLYIFGNRPVSVEILSQLRLNELGAASAYAVILMCIVAASTMVFRRMGAR